ncbi:Protein fam72a [Nowakowskiella sp. JEL0078]|nr:Protein fam72a [Nowakowskiella sp. JEL0078]
MSISSSTTTLSEPLLEQLFRNNEGLRNDLSTLSSDAGTSEVVDQTRLHMARFSQRITQSMNSTSNAMLEYARVQARAARNLRTETSIGPNIRDNSTAVFPSAILDVVAAITADTQASEGSVISILPASSLISNITHLAGGRLNRGEIVNPSIHPQFRSKTVCKLFCKACGELMCLRGMKAILLGNAKVELFSTDIPPNGVQLVYEDYTTQLKMLFGNRVANVELRMQLVCAVGVLLDIMYPSLVANALSLVTMV